jgi:hypothetical protein
MPSVKLLLKPLLLFIKNVYCLWIVIVVDEQSKKELKDILISYDRTLLVADPRRCEPKKVLFSVN